MCKALEELQAVPMMLCKMAFHLSGKKFASSLDDSNTKAYLCNQGGIASHFLSRISCCILNLVNKHGILLIQHTYLPTHPNVEAIYCREGTYTNQFQHYYTLENPLPLEALVLNAFKHPGIYQMGYVFCLPA